MRIHLFLLGFALSLVLDASAPPGHAIEAKANADATAKEATAWALLDSLPLVPNFYDAQTLAELGDFANARALAKRLHPSEEKVRALRFVAGCAARSALENRRFPQAEPQIRDSGDGSASLWIELSRAYSAAKRPADARRTAFYALTQIRHEKDAYSWPDAVLRLCEIGERAAARRFLLVAKKELLDPDPLMGSALNPVVETAARCGFDDLVAEMHSQDLFSSFSLIGIYAARNRDDLARHVIEQAMVSAKEIHQPVAAPKQPGEPGTAGPPQRTAQQTQDNFELFLLFLLSKAQLQRDDVPAARATWQQAETLLSRDENAPQWSSNTLFLLRLYESSAQWNKADAAAARLQMRWSRGEAPLLKEPLTKFSDSASQTRALSQALLLGLDVASQPNKFGLKVRGEALQRVTPRLLRFTEDYPETKSRALRSLARAQRSVGERGWRLSLQAAQIEAVAAAKTKNQWDELPLVAQEWQEAGEVERARALSRELLKFWNSNQAKALSGDAMKGGQTRNQLSLLHLLESGRYFQEATDLLIPRRGMDIGLWESEFRQLSKSWQSAPPRKLLELPRAERHTALLGWAQGLAPAEPVKSETTNMSSITFNQNPF